MAMAFEINADSTYLVEQRVGKDAGNVGIKMAAHWLTLRASL